MRMLRSYLSRLEWQIVIVYMLAQMFYLFTLAPTVLWGDDAKFQRQAYELDLASERAWDHPLWVLAAHPFTKLPLKDVAYRVNLFTSVCAAIAVAFVFASVRRLTRSGWSGAASAGSLAISHTFWTHAVRTEVYSFALLLLAVSIYCLLRPRLNRTALGISAIAIGLAVNSHVMMWIVVPALGLLALWRILRERLGLGSLLVFIAALVLTVVVYQILLPSGRLVSLNPADYVLSPGDFMVAAAMLVLYIILQFPSPAIVMVIAGIRRSFSHLPVAISLILIFFADAAVVLKFKVPDTYVFFILAYFVCTFWIGLGFGPVLRWLHHRTGCSQRAIAGLLLAGILILPVAAYASAPPLLARMGVTGKHLRIRQIPGRPPLKFFLWPSKRGYLGARNFAEMALAQVAPGAVVVADHTLRQPMLYLKRVEGRRTDVEVVELYLDEQVSFALAESKHRPVYLARTEPYYDIEGLARYFTVVPEGNVYRLELLE